MHKDLPKVYANPINKTLNNNKEIFYSNNSHSRSVNTIDITKEINNIFASSHHVYKSKVHIKTVNDEFDATIIGKSGNNLLTLSGEKININTIEDIKRL